jgi:hypothetical protein
MKLAPIALFVYNRPWHTRQTIEALQKNILASESDLIVFSDGPKDSKKDRGDIAKVREYIKNITGFRSVKIIKKEYNLGLADSIISGVNEIINECGKIIVLEDDMVSSRFFLKYMNKSLDLYEHEDEVISIHGYIYPIETKMPETFFLKGADCWGWATWKRGWDLFESDGKKLLKELEDKKLTKEFDFSGAYPYTRMLKDQTNGKNNSWAIRWYASAFLKNKLTLYPGKSLINNIGLDGSGANCYGDYNFVKNYLVENIKIEVKKIEIKENSEVRKYAIEFLRIQNNLCIRTLRYLKIVLKFILNKFFVTV